MFTLLVTLLVVLQEEPNTTDGDAGLMKLHCSHSHGPLSGIRLYHWFVTPLIGGCTSLPWMDSQSMQAANSIVC